MADNPPRARERFILGAVICIYIIVCCVSLIYVSDDLAPTAYESATYHMFFDPARLHIAVLTVAAFSIVSSFFIFARFSIGYFVGLYFYTMVLGYLWLNCFTDLIYDHRLAGLSAAASAIAFLLPALFISAPIRQVYVLSATAFDRLLLVILVLAVAIIAVGAAYNFRIVSIRDIYLFREKLESPTTLNYLIGITSGALLPFAFAGFAARRAYWLAAAVLLLLLFLYPINLSKFALFTPAWLVIVLILSKLFEARLAVVLSLLVPMLAGIVLISLFPEKAIPYFFTVNFRTIAIPSTALDVYNDFFSRHDPTYFCQMSFVKRFVACPYREPLAIIMERTYDLGNYNASLFATEGIASVGVLFAPVAVLVCGFVFAVGNRLSAGLPSDFVLTSAAVLPQILLNVPLTIVLLTYGAGLLFLLWYITPRTIFRTEDGGAKSGCAGNAGNAVEDRKLTLGTKARNPADRHRRLPPRPPENSNGLR
ncbi:MAG: hypothetical protein QOE02_5301 [Rhodospirillaceae bacterium]|nr:hypothetical protein [Rhodospirillaceae bacterium]